MDRKLAFVVIGLAAWALIPSSHVSSQPAPSVPDIDLTVSEWSNVARTNEIVTSGVPIPAGATGASWALFDGATEIPVQTTVLPGLKTPWVLLDFRSTIGAGATKTYTLKQQSPTASASPALAYDTTGGQISVTTGPAKFQINTTTYNLFDNVWIDNNGDGDFADAGENVITPNVTSNLQVVNASPSNTYSGQGTPTAVTWEYQGPLRAVLRVDGNYVGPSINGSTTLMTFTTRFTFYAGQKYVNVEHVLRNSSATQERYIKLSSATLRLGTGTATNRAARSGDTLWANVSSTGLTTQLLATSFDTSPGYAPYATPVVWRSNITVNTDSNGGLLIGDLSYYGATVRMDFSSGLSGSQATQLTTIAKDPLIALAPASWYSDQGAFGTDHFSTYEDEKNTYTKWGWTWPTPGNSLSNEHAYPRSTAYPSWSTVDSENDPESDPLWENVSMLSRVRLPVYLDELRSWTRYWKWEWAFRTDGFSYAADFNSATRAPVIQPTLTAADTDYIERDMKYGKAVGYDHLWNGGLLDDYYLTGDRDALTASLDIAEECQKLFATATLPNAGVGGDERYQSRCLLVLTRTWEATNDQQWKTAMDHMIPFFLQSPRYDQRGFFFKVISDFGPTYTSRYAANGKYISSFHVATIAQALYRYYLLTNDSAVRAMLIQMGQFARDSVYNGAGGYGPDEIVVDSPTTGSILYQTTSQLRNLAPVVTSMNVFYSQSFIPSLVVAYRLTGDGSFLNQAKNAWSKTSKGDIGSPIATDTQVGRWANAQNYLDWTYVDMLFYDAARQDTTPPAAVNDLSAAHGSYTLTADRHRLTLRPFGTAYRDKLWAKRVTFSASKTTLYFFVPVKPTSRAAIAIYNSRGKRIATVKPFRRFARLGLNLNLRLLTMQRKLFLAVGSKDLTPRAEIFEVTSMGLRSTNLITPPHARPGANVVVTFLKLYPDNYNLVTFVPGQTNTAQVWRYSLIRNRFVGNKYLSLKRLKFSGSTVTLKN